MSHGPSIEWKKDNAAKFKSRLGIILFIVYTLVYAGFIIINLVNPKLMAIDIGSQNLAIVYGFGLIILALVLAVIYNQACSRAEERLNNDNDEKPIAKNNEIGGNK